MDEVNKSITDDMEFLVKFRELLPGILEKFNVGSFTELQESWFPQLSPEEQAVYARFWYYTEKDQLDSMRDYYGFSALAVVDITDENSCGIILGSTADENHDDAMLRNVIDSETKRNGTLSKYTKRQSENPKFAAAYNGRIPAMQKCCRINAHDITKSSGISGGLLCLIPVVFFVAVQSFDALHFRFA